MGQIYGGKKGIKEMSFSETVNYLGDLLVSASKDLNKAHRGNKAAAQRVRVATIRLEKIGKRFRKESVAVEKGGRLRKRGASKKGKLKKKKR